MKELSLQTPRASAGVLCRMNELTERFGLTLTNAQAVALLRRQEETLREAGRIDFGGGVLPRLAEAFCDSAYLTQDTYAETLGELQEMFYEAKNESLDRLTDGELIEEMKRAFDNEAAGSLEYVSSITLERLCRRARGCLLEDEPQQEEPDDTVE